MKSGWTLLLDFPSQAEEMILYGLSWTGSLKLLTLFLPGPLIVETSLLIFTFLGLLACTESQVGLYLIEEHSSLLDSGKSCTRALEPSYPLAQHITHRLMDKLSV